MNESVYRTTQKMICNLLLNRLNENTFEWTETGKECALNDLGKTNGVVTNVAEYP